MNTTNHLIRNSITYFPKIALVFILSLLCSSSLFAQRAGGNGTIYGRILDADTGRFMQNAEITVTVDGISTATVSEQGGFYVLSSIPPGEATVSVNYAGYITEKKTVAVTTGGRVTADFELRLTPSSLSAPSASETKDDVVMLDKLTVTTERAGNARAFMDQKNSMTMSTVLATDSFGTVPNGNIAEFLRNMPGLSALEDDVTGEADQISIGGMDPSLTGVYLNGARMASGAKGGFDEDSRSFRFDQVSINGIESIEIRRTVSADMEGDAPAGGIVMRTKSAFDSKTALFRYDAFFTTNSYNMNLKRTPGADDGKSIKLQPGFNMSYSTPFRQGTMGLLVQLSAQEDFRETNRVDAIPRGDLKMISPFLDQVTYRNSQTQSERLSGSIQYDWKISPYAKFSIQYSHDMRNTTSFNRNVLFKTGRNNTSDSSSLLVISAPENETATQNSISQTASYNTSKTDTITSTFNWKRYRFTLDGVFTFSYGVGNKNPTNDKWFSRVNMYRSRTDASNDYSLWGERSSTREMDWSFYRGHRATMTADDSLTGEMGDIGRYKQDGTYALLEELPSNNKQTIPTLKVDLRWDAPTKFPLWFKTGFNGRKSIYNAWQPVDGNRTALANHYQYIGAVSVLQPTIRGTSAANYDAGVNAAYVDPNVPRLSDPYFLSDYHFDPHFGGNISDLNIPVINQTLLYQTYKDNPDWFYRNPNDTLNDRIAGYTGRRNLSETIYAGYFMGEVRPWKGFVFQAGYRYEYTDQEAITLIPLTRGQTLLAVGGDPGMEGTDQWVDAMYKKGERTTTTNSYSFLLPSAAVKYNFTPNLTAHLGYSEGFGRVSVDKLASNWRVRDTEMEAYAPNPNLEPDHYRTYSAAFEYYFEPAGSFTFTYSYRKWDGTSYTETPIESNDPNNPALRNLIELYGEDTVNAFLDSNYIIYTWEPESVENRAMQTLEFSYRQRIPAIPGLQVDANFTRVVPNWRKEGAASAPKLASGGISYSNRNMYIRVSGNWRSRYWQNWPVEDLDYKQRIGVHARFLLNAELVYRISRGFSLYLRGDNLLNSPQSQYRNSAAILSQETLTGISFRVGVKGDF
ncbi:MAG: TonB-dependent receptor [Opitutaceae bacterium]|jgi:TonB-dependent receptor|nr:TonB-dependent receptor [Opitutaceae bacterium]